MLKSLLPLFAILLLLSSCSEEKTERTLKMFPSDWLFAQRAFPEGEIDQKAYLNAIKQNKSFLERHNQKEGYDNPWNFEGPTNIEGRITDIEMFNNQQNTIFACTAAGGIFRSDDQGQSWSPIFDGALSLSIGDMDISNSNQEIMYVGTGESNAGGGSLAYDGVGVYKSMDGGTNWTHIGLEKAGSIGKVVIDPSNPDKVFVSTMGALFKKNDERGVYRTIDGGANWEQVLFVSDSTGAIDLAVNPENPDIIYAAMWERIRTVQTRRYGGATSGVFKSIDGGTSWTELGGGLPTDSSQKGRIGLAIAQTNTNTLYAYYAATDGNLVGIFKTVDGGNNWEKQSSNNISDVPYIWWFGKIFVDPTNENRVFVASFDMHESTDGGSSWGSSFPGVHVDQHAIFIHPNNPQLVVNGNDGGVHISLNGGSEWFRTANLPITQFYTCEIDPNNTQRLYGGAQDNGTNRTLTGSDDDWTSIYGGDGFVVTVDPQNSNIIYAEFQGGGLAKSTNGGNNFSSAVSGISNSDRKNWKTPYVLDPNNSDILYYGSQKLYKSENQASTWTVISGDLTDGPYPGVLGYGTITTISVSKLNDQKIIIGTDDGNIWITEDGGQNYNHISADIPKRWVTAVLASPFDENKLYVTVSGFRFGENIGHVFMSKNKGEDWIDISSNLPDIPVNDIIADTELERALYIATDAGIYYSLEDGSSWELLGQELPNVPIIDIDFLEGERILIAASFGRSMYSYLLPGNVATEDIDEHIQLSIYPNPAKDKLFINLHKIRGQKTVIKIMDIKGLEIMTAIIKPGQSTFEWDISNFTPGIYFVVLQNKHDINSYSIIKY